MNQSDTWQYLTRDNPRVTSAEFHESRHGEAKKTMQKSRYAIWRFNRSR
jgi:hypothetical protein